MGRDRPNGFCGVPGLCEGRLPKGTSTLTVLSYGLALATAILFVLNQIFGSDKSLAIHGKALLLMFCIGTCLAIANFAVLWAFRHGAPQSGFTAVYNPTFLIVGIVIGLVIWHERPTPVQLLGLGVILGGVLIYSLGKTIWS